MINDRTTLLCSLVTLSVLTIISCSKKEKEQETNNHALETHASKADEQGHEHGEEGSGATFEEGKGILLIDETKEAIGLELAEVTENALQANLSITAQIYRAASEISRKHGRERFGYAYATAMLLPEVAKPLKQGQKVIFNQGETNSIQEGTVWKLDETQFSILGKVEVLIELPDPKASLTVGSFVNMQILDEKESRKALTIPASAVLQTANGVFAFVQNGSHLLRTEIKIGAKSKDHVEVVEGLYEGDTIAVKPVEALYLIELRATKGGGHSH